METSAFTVCGVSVSRVCEAPDEQGLVHAKGQAATLLLEPSGSLFLQHAANGSEMASCSISRKSVCRIGRRTHILSTSDSKSEDSFRSWSLEFPGSEQADKFEEAVERCLAAQAHTNAFDRKTDKGSADTYFYYYGMFQHQQNMLQDIVRTGTYYCAILENRADFDQKVVVDVGAGSSILSQFACQAGARKVYAIEASPIAKWAAQLCKQNPVSANVVEVVEGMVEVVDIPEQADILISEPMGTLLVNERMLESYLYARDKFLKPGGKMFPAVGRIHLAAFSDPILHTELANKGLFWTCNNFYGVDLTPVYEPAANSFFNQVVVDAFDPSLLVSEARTEVLDFRTMKEEELHEIRMPLNLKVGSTCVVHGIACWFDVLFDGSTMKCWLTTAPGQPTTHWFQLRCALETPLHVQAGSFLTGEMVLTAHERQSYDIYLTLKAPPTMPGRSEQVATARLDLKDPYYRQLQGAWQQPSQNIATQQPPPPPPPPRQE
mmetsp:Transcript_10054/g.18126  ORF Transcript_10054/g.18126 Transcript_10054/m.18126 type:complete len:492 (-) Transcript_10054:58-1533(-)